MASDEELSAANAFLSIAAFGSTAIGFAGAGLLASTVGLQWAFIIDAASFVFAAGCIALMGNYAMPTPDDDASVAVIVSNLKSGMTVLFGTPIIRSLFVVGAFMFFSFGLWNVLLLPFTLKTLHATEFQYGLQEGLTSVGFVAGSFFMARFSSKLPEPAWIVLALEFALAADLIRTIVAPGWVEIGQLGAIAAIRTGLSWFLSRDFEEVEKEAPAELL